MTVARIGFEQRISRATEGGEAMWLRWVVSNLIDQVTEDKVRQAVDRAKQVAEPVLRARQKPQVEGQESGTPAAEPHCDIVMMFALALESGGLVDQMTDAVTTHCATFVERSGMLGGRRVVVCESGVGREAAAQATEDAIKIFRPQWIISAGFAGALMPQMRRGHILMATSIIDQHKHPLEIGFKIDPAIVHATPSLHVGSLLTLDKLVRDREEKVQLAGEYHAAACDMETMAVAQACRRRQVGFLSVRVISDELDDRLPREVEHLLDQTTLAAKLGAVTRAVFHRPRSIQDMWNLRETALKASDRLAKFLVGVVPQLAVPTADGPAPDGPAEDSPAGGNV